jgi:hypothetical protein
MFSRCWYSKCCKNVILDSDDGDQDSDSNKGPVIPRRRRYTRRRKDRLIKGYADAMEPTNYDLIPPVRKDIRQVIFMV